MQLRRKQSSLLPLRRSRIASESAATDPTAQKSQDAHALRRAFRNNPYNKLHYKYNPNLVGEEDQELTEHLHRRHLNARRMTRLASSTRLPNQPRSRPRTASCDMNLPEGVVELVERHEARRRTMSGRQYGPAMRSHFSSPEPGFSPLSPHILKALQEASEPSSGLQDVEAQVTRPSAVELSPVGSSALSSDSAEGMNDKTSASATEDHKNGEELPLVTHPQVTPGVQSSTDKHEDDSV